MPKHDPRASKHDPTRPIPAPWFATAALGLAASIVAPAGAIRPALAIVAVGAAGWGLVRERTASSALRQAASRAHDSATEARGVAAVAAASRAVHGLHEMDELTRAALAEGVKLLGAASGSLMLIDDAGYLQTAATQGGNGRARNARMKLGDGVAGQVALTRQPALLDGAPDPKRFPRAVQREAPLRSAMSVPLLAGDNVLGVINMNGADGRLFTGDDLDLLCAFAGHASTAIVNAGALRAERRRVSDLEHLRQTNAETISRVAHDLSSGSRALEDLIETLGVGAPVDHETLDSLSTGLRRISASAAKLRGRGRPLDATRGHPHGTDLAALARTVAEDFLAQGREVIVLPADACHVSCDEDLLRQALWNLLEGAFTLGKPPVTISVRRDGSEGIVSVADRGLPSNIRAQGGDGLGMGVSIVHGLVTSIGGRVWADNDLDGTAFRIALPIQEPRVASMRREAG